MVSTISGFNHCSSAKSGAAKTCDDCLDIPEGQTWLSEKENYPSHGTDGSMSRCQLSHSTSNLWCLTWMHNSFCSSDAAFPFLWGNFYVCSCPRSLENSLFKAVIKKQSWVYFKTIYIAPLFSLVRQRMTVSHQLLTLSIVDLRR